MSQESIILRLLERKGSEGATPQEIREALDAVPSGKPRKDGMVYHKAPAILVSRLRARNYTIRTVIENGVTRYYL